MHYFHARKVFRTQQQLQLCLVAGYSKNLHRDEDIRSILTGWNGKNVRKSVHNSYCCISIAILKIPGRWIPKNLNILDCSDKILHRTDCSKSLKRSVTRTSIEIVCVRVSPTFQNHVCMHYKHFGVQTKTMSPPPLYSTPENQDGVR